MAKVIVLGCNPGGLAVIRSLGRRGIHVIAMTHSRSDIGTVSRYCRETVWCPHPDDPAELADFLVSNKKWHGSIIIEAGDYFAVMLSRHQELLSRYYKFITPDWPTLSKFVQKNNTYEYADQCGVPHPQSFNVEGIEDIEPTIAGIQLPCIIKPSVSHEFVAKLGTKLLHIDSIDLLREKLLFCVQNNIGVMVQEIVPGPESNLIQVKYFINSNGQIAWTFMYQKVRQSPPKFGVIRVGKSIAPIPELDALGRRLVEGCNYRGVIGCEFKIDERDGTPKLIEVNNRMGRSTALPMASGIDIPWIIYNELANDRHIVVPNYTANVYWIEILPDFLNLMVRDNWSEFSLKEFFTPYFSRHREFAVFWWLDPLPFFKQLYYLGFQAKREHSVRRLAQRQPA